MPAARARHCPADPASSPSPRRPARKSRGFFVSGATHDPDGRHGLTRTRPLDSHSWMLPKCRQPCLGSAGKASRSTHRPSFAGVIRSLPRSHKEKPCPRPPSRFASGEFVPLEMHKVRVVQKLNLLPVSARLEAMEGAGFNTFLLKNHDVFLDMLTDSGTNAMSDRQVGAMMVADDAYAGSASFDRLQQAVLDVFGTPFFLPVHQGRAAEHIISQAFITRGQAGPHELPLHHDEGPHRAGRRPRDGTLHGRGAQDPQPPPLQGQPGHRPSARLLSPRRAGSTSPTSAWRRAPT